MVALNLTATGKEQELIKGYLQQNASSKLAAKINNGTPFEKDGKPLINRKTIDGFMKFACDEARKLANKGANSACIEDETEFGWAIYYFEEGSILGTLYYVDGSEYQPPKTKINPKTTTTPITPRKPEQKA